MRVKKNISNNSKMIVKPRQTGRRIIVGIFSLAILMMASFSTYFINTTQAKNSGAFADDPITGCPTNYTALGGTVGSAPTAATINSRVVVFARGTDGVIYYKISAGSPFSDWTSLGGGTNSAPMSKIVGTTLYVEVVGTDGNRYFRTTIDGFTYTDWTRGTVGATTTPTTNLGTVTYNFVSGLAGSKPNLCVLETGGATPTPTPTITPIPTPTGAVNAVTGCPANYTAIGGTVGSAPTTNVLGNRIVVFVRGTDGSVYFKYSNGGAFSDWNFLAGGTNSAPMSITIGGTIYVEIIGTDGNRYYKSSTDGLGYSEWVRGTVGATTNATGVLGTTGYGFLSGLTGTQPNLCVLTTSGATPTPSATPTPVASPTPAANTVTGCPANYTALGGTVTSVPTAGLVNNRVVVFAKGTDGAIYYQFTNDFPFSGWRNLGGNATSAPSSVLVGTTLYVEVTGTDGKRYYRGTTDGVSFSEWTQGTFGVTTATSSATLGTTRYDFLNGLTGSQPNLCVALSTGVTPTPTPTPPPTPTPAATNAVTGCPANYSALGGTVTSVPTANIINNKVVVFAKGTDNGIYYQNSTGGTFSAWIPLGNTTTAAPMSIVIGSTLYVEIIGTGGARFFRSTTDGSNFTDWVAGTFGATTNSSAILGTTRYDFVSGLTGTSPNLCVFVTPGVTPTPTPTPTPVTNPSTGCAADFISLGGTIASDPTAIVFNSRVYVYARGTDNAIYYQFSGGNTFSGWNGLGGGSNANPKSIVIGATMYVEVVGTDNNNYYKSTTDGNTFGNWIQGTQNATTNSVVSFGGRTYTFVKGISSAPHLCLKIQ